MMQEHCSRCDRLCTCQDWQNGDLTRMVNHLIDNFHFIGFELSYRTLEPGEDGRMLCCIGRCTRCGRRLCHGNKLPADISTGDLLKQIYRWAFTLWHKDGQPSVHGASVFSVIFLALFHGEDRPVVEKWLRKPDTVQFRRSCHQDGLEG